MIVVSLSLLRITKIKTKHHKNSRGGDQVMIRIVDNFYLTTQLDYRLLFLMP